VKLAGSNKSESIEFPAGTFLVRTAQPLALLACCLLDPQSDDGLVTWNSLDKNLEASKPYPVLKVGAAINPSSRVIDP
jgi:hypothetical protein